MAEYKFRPVLDRVLIHPEEAPKVSDGGILLGSVTSYRGYVAAVGPSVVSVKEGDYVYYDPNGCGGIELGGEFFHVARDIAEGAIAVVLESKS